MLEPGRGLEPLTYRLQVGCASNCATRAGVGELSRLTNTKTIRRSGSKLSMGAVSVCRKRHNVSQIRLAACTEGYEQRLRMALRGSRSRASRNRRR